MKRKTKRSVTFLLVGVCLTSGIFGHAAVSYASEESTARTLSLEEAYSLFCESDAYRLIELQNESDSVTVKSYSEQISSNNEVIRSESEDKTSAKNSNNTLKEKRSYAESLLESNREARENAAYQELVTMYYELKNAEKSLENAETNLEMVKDTYELAELKYQYGSVSKLDVLNSQIDLQKAENQVQKQENTYRIKMMQFNSYLGLSIGTKLTLTSEPDEISLPEGTLEEAIESALENRTEFISAEYSLSEAQRSFNSVSAYPSSSSTYLKAKIALTQAQIDYNSVENDITIDVTEQYQGILEKYDTIKTDKLNLQSAEEALDLAKSRYELGMSTLADVQSAQLTLENARSTYNDDLISFRLAAENFNLCKNAGTTVVNF